MNIERQILKLLDAIEISTATQNISAAGRLYLNKVARMGGHLNPVECPHKLMQMTLGFKNYPTLLKTVKNLTKAGLIQIHYRKGFSSLISLNVDQITGAAAAKAA